jgi:hypothetical protein
MTARANNMTARANNMTARPNNMTARANAESPPSRKAAGSADAQVLLGLVLVGLALGDPAGV